MVLFSRRRKHVSIYLCSLFLPPHTIILLLTKPPAPFCNGYGASVKSSHMDRSLLGLITSEWVPFSYGYPVVTRSLARKCKEVMHY